MVQRHEVTHFHGRFSSGHLALFLVRRHPQDERRYPDRSCCGWSRSWEVLMNRIIALTGSSWSAGQARYP